MPRAEDRAGSPLPWLPRWFVLAISCAIFLTTTLLHYQNSDLAAPLQIINVIPVALLALEFGLPGGLAAAAAAFASFVVWSITNDVHAHATDYVFRATVFFVEGVLIGSTAARLKRTRRELSDANALLERRAGELEQANAELRDFAYVASHDLSEPLRTISGFAQLIDRRYSDQLDDRGRQFIAEMVGGVARMQVLISDLLAYSRASQHEIDPAEVDTDRVTTEVAQSLARQLSDSHAELRLGEMPVVRGNETLIRQVFQNLISNAVKFSRNGHPHVTVAAERHGAMWRFSVIDDGIGIDPEHRERIFRPFQRLHGRDEYAGTGIGLAICRRIVERHEGRIWVESAPGQGSTFVFELPAQLTEGRALNAR